ncbi:hypothetical protein BD309DRAFT_877139 [Dichomitus squalens]|uniref:Uncharacterized protein n=1 Tax=Dichomitus squalens TaxID=114155 RepID=A0A4Q9PEJ6_9APHY|nr:hypothetical protein BD309DRAFT_877139 [Dichomitus squalens]TBU53340.1 hypothetical protein BD310DRAFT_830284 [Dichomitus squalens]
MTTQSFHMTNEGIRRTDGRLRASSFCLQTSAYFWVQDLHSDGNATVSAWNRNQATLPGCPERWPPTSSTIVEPAARSYRKNIHTLNFFLVRSAITAYLASCTSTLVTQRICIANAFMQARLPMGLLPKVPSVSAVDVTIVSFGRLPLSGL